MNITEIRPGRCYDVDAQDCDVHVTFRARLLTVEDDVAYFDNGVVLDIAEWHKNAFTEV